MKNYISLSFCCLLLMACQSGHAQHYLNLYGIAPPTKENFTHCFNYGCQTQRSVSLPKYTKRKIQNLFGAASKTDKQERKKISKAIGIFETDIGALTGTKDDKHGTFRLYQDGAKTTKRFQQDCIDESTNTTIYLLLLEKMNLLTFHKTSFAANRQPFISHTPWWHQTAVIEDITTGKKYAVDSWFRDNGHTAFIVPLKEWKKGWRPPKIKS